MASSLVIKADFKQLSVMVSAHQAEVTDGCYQIAVG